MKAAAITSFSSPLEIVEMAKPVPGPRQLLVRMEVSGLCRTDVHAAQGDWPVRPRLPLVPGHEGIGIVEARGTEVDNHAVGDRVAIAWLGGVCGQCRYCVDGRENLCEAQLNTGYSVNGTLAEYAVTDAAAAVGVPTGVDPFDAAPLTCAGVSAYKAIKVARIMPTERVAVFGIGGLGHLAVQYARLVGATVIAVDVEEGKLELSRRLGAHHCVNARNVKPVEAIRDLGGADVAVVLAPSNEVFGQAFRALRRGGRMVCIALPGRGEFTIPVFDTVMHGLTVTGSVVGTRNDLREVFELHAQGQTQVVAERRRLEEINTSIEQLLYGAVPARIVFDLRPEALASS